MHHDNLTNPRPIAVVPHKTQGAQLGVLTAEIRGRNFPPLVYRFFHQGFWIYQAGTTHFGHHDNQLIDYYAI